MPNRPSTFSAMASASPMTRCSLQSSKISPGKSTTWITTKSDSRPTSAISEGSWWTSLASRSLPSWLTLGLNKPLPAIMHYSSPAPPMTKYDMTKIIAKHLGLPIQHVVPDANKPIVKPGQTERPENTQLATDALKELGVDTREDETFDEWWGRYIAETK